MTKPLVTVELAGSYSKEQRLKRYCSYRLAISARRGKVSGSAGWRRRAVAARATLATTSPRNSRSAILSPLRLLRATRETTPRAKLVETGRETTCSFFLRCGVFFTGIFRGPSRIVEAGRLLQSNAITVTLTMVGSCLTHTSFHDAAAITCTRETRARAEPEVDKTLATPCRTSASDGSHVDLDHVCQVVVINDGGRTDRANEQRLDQFDRLHRQTVPRRDKHPRFPRRNESAPTRRFPT